MNQWIANILGVVVLGILMDMIIPSGNTKAYSRFFIGLVMLLVMIQPVLKLVGRFPEYSDSFWMTKIAPELGAIDTSSQAIELNREEHLLRMYKSRLEEDVVERVKAYMPDTDVSAYVALEKSQGATSYIIDTIQVFLGSKDPYRVKGVEIFVDLGGEGQKGAPSTEIRSESDDVLPLKKHLSETYEIDESRIYIDSKTYDKGG